MHTQLLTFAGLARQPLTAACLPFVASSWISCGGELSGTDCTPDLTAFESPMVPYSEPDRPTVPWIAPFLEDDGVDSFHSGLILPPEANAGERETSYWLTGDEPLAFTVQLVKNWEDPRRPPGWVGGSIHVFVDGVLVHTVEKVSYGYERANEYEVVLPGDRLEDGAHVVSVVIDSGGLPDLHQFNAFKNDTRWGPDLATSTAFERGSGELDATGWVPSTRGISRMGGLLELAFPGDELPVGVEVSEGRFTFEAKLVMAGVVTPELHACPKVEQDYVIVALLDGEPIDVGGHGLRVRATLRAGEHGVLPVRFEGLPTDGKEHVLKVFRLRAYGRYLEDPRGEPTVWHSVSLLARAPLLGSLRWGFSP